MLNCPKTARDGSGHSGQTCKVGVTTSRPLVPTLSQVGTRYEVAAMVGKVLATFCLDSGSKTDQFMSCPRRQVL